MPGILGCFLALRPILALQIFVQLPLQYKCVSRKVPLCNRERGNGDQEGLVRNNKLKQFELFLYLSRCDFRDEGSLALIQTSDMKLGAFSNFNFTLFQG